MAYKEVNMPLTIFINLFIFNHSNPKRHQSRLILAYIKNHLHQNDTNIYFLVLYRSDKYQILSIFQLNLLINL